MRISPVLLSAVLLAGSPGLGSYEAWGRSVARGAAKTGPAIAGPIRGLTATSIKTALPVQAGLKSAVLPAATTSIGPSAPAAPAAPSAAPVAAQSPLAQAAQAQRAAAAEGTAAAHDSALRQVYEGSGNLAADAAVDAAAPSAGAATLAPAEVYDADVIVVGGGLAGLMTARLLAKKGVSVKVLEARDRVGGRTWSKDIGKARFDLGGQWLGPGDKRMLALVKELGIETFPTFTGGRRVLELDGKRRTYKGLIPPVSIFSLVKLQLALMRLEKMRKQVDLDDPMKSERAREWDGQTVETWARSLPRAARELFDMGVRSIMSAEPAEVSLLHFLFYLNASGGFEHLAEVKDGAQETRFMRGSQEVSLKLAAELGDKIQLSSPVSAIEQDETGVTVRTAQGALRAKRVVMALPPALAGRLDYSPALPGLRDQLTQRMPMGGTIKVIVTYDKPFWRKKGLSGEAISNDGPVTATWDNTSGDGEQPALVGLMVGENARRWGTGKKSAEQRKAAVIEQLVRLFGPEAANISEYVEQEWACEPFTRGCYVGSMPPGAWTQFGEALRQPVGRVHFAGTETAREGNGYMEGAVESAERASAEVLELASPRSAP